MPRRVSDYPDGFAGWNLVSSIGSIISVIATFVFLYIIYSQLVHTMFSKKNPWAAYIPFSDAAQQGLMRNSDSIEWLLNSPPKHHSYINLPTTNNIMSIIYIIVKTILRNYIKCIIFNIPKASSYVKYT
jgi:cytochrome c oxidase subunit 1